MAEPSDNSAPSVPTPRGVVFSVALVVVGFALFIGAVWFAFVRTRPTNLDPDVSKLDKTEQWKFSAEGREARLKELQARVAAADSYGVIDAKGGVVRLPIERAMELVVREHAKDRP